MKKIIVLCVVIIFSAIIFAESVSEFPGNLIGSGFENISPNMAVGNAIQVGNKYLVPIFEVNTFFLGGGGGKPLIASGSAGTVNLIPYSVIIISDDGIEIKSLSNKEPVLKQLMEALPQIISMLMQYLTIDQSSFERVPPTTVEEFIVMPGPQPSTDLKEESSLNADEIMEKSIERLSMMLKNNPNQASIQSAQTETKHLLQIEPENARLLGLYAYSILRLIDQASPFEMMQMSMEAQRTITKALSLDPEDYFVNLSNGWLNLYSPMGNMNVSIAAFEKVIQINPNLPEAYLGIVQAFLKSGKRDKAIEYAQKGKEIDPQSAEEFDELLN